MPSSTRKIARQLDWSKRALADRERIARYYNAVASLLIAMEADAAIVAAAERATAAPLRYRQGKKAGTRECVLRRFPFIVVFRVTDNRVRIVRVMHQAAEYFN